MQFLLILQPPYSLLVGIDTYFYPNALIIIFAHRDVLLSQISIAAAKVGLPHQLLCSQATKVQISHAHIDELGESFICNKSTIVVASVPTWVKRNTQSMSEKAALWLMDEFHHCLEENMWGKSVLPMENALGLGVTATPKRADGKGLGRSELGGSGVADCIVQTPGMGELIAMGNLSPYKVFTIPNDLDVSDVNITSSGDYNQRKLAVATKKSHIIGDAIHHYQRLANGKQGIIFAASVEHSEIVASQFRNAGYTAVALSSKSNVSDRHSKIKKFRNGEIQLLVNYDLFGEGFDVPAVEVVILLRKTMSYSLFKQMFGRALRPLEGKEYGILIDHVGNVREHCLPGKHLHDDPEWQLENEEKRSSSSGGNTISRTCPECFHFYVPASGNPKNFVCPSCGHAENQDERNQAQKEIQTQDGVLVEYDTGFLNEVLDKIKQVDTPVEQFKNKMRHAPPVVAASAVKRHRERQESQNHLRPLIGQWCDQIAKYKGLDVPTTQGEFERHFGVNIYEAQTLSASESQTLRDKINKHFIESMFDTFI